ncbi:hypothetical protein AOL_s00043g180 [Orbilia oligospora ATCC 24927]|uniref:Uncharacterized protein n=1 Tax=Arthrobotrys oligospora (strain ATCC 24927 / CBS 115.81 / DSM 1491) TaxID=756982 RepID=G1X3A7_ARTOA|nr:hypothetical protein AOL_s00043g180 [Orbilia oligospora ATCC 24927]EGX52391.1 hypothetical protein AOL_s00043g180 [Orbilia oligospora ATCC 24927]
MSSSWVERGKKLVYSFTTSSPSVQDNNVYQTRSSPRKNPPLTDNNTDMGADKRKRGYKSRPQPDHSGRSLRSHHSPPRKSDYTGPDVTGPQNTTQKSKTDVAATYETDRKNDTKDQRKSALLEDSTNIRVKPAEPPICVDITDSGGTESPNTQKAVSPEIPYNFCKSCGCSVELGSKRKDLCKLCRAYQRVGELEEQLNKSELRLAEAISCSNWAESKMEKLQREAKDQESKLQQLNQKNRNWKLDYDSLRDDYNTLQDNSSTMIQRLRTTELEIGKLQKTELARLYQEEVLLDTTAKDCLSNDLFTKVKVITRKCFRRIPWESSVGVFPNLDQIFPGMFIGRWTKTQWPMIRDNPDFGTLALVDAVLFSIITTRFFKNPFFRAESDPEVKQALDKVYLSERQGNVKNMELWRKTTAILLKELSLKGVGDHQDSVTTEEAKTNPSQLVLDKVSSELETFISNFLSIHKAPSGFEPSELERKIYDLVASSANLADDWHSRDFRLSIIDIDWLESQGIDWCTEGASKYVTAFPKNKRLEENVNYTIAAVITPGFIRYEKGDTEGSEIEIIWEPASVLLEEVDSGGIKVGMYGLRNNWGKNNPFQW